MERVHIKTITHQLCSKKRKTGLIKKNIRIMWRGKVFSFSPEKGTQKRKYKNKNNGKIEKLKNRKNIHSTYISAPFLSSFLTKIVI